MKKIFQPLGIIVAAALVFTGTTGFSPHPSEAGVVEDAEVTTEVEVIDDTTSLVTIDVPESSGVEGSVEVLVTDDTPEEVAIEAIDEDGEEVGDTFSVEDLTVYGEEDFAATIRSESTGESVTVDTTQAQEQALPAILVVLAVKGLQIALKQASKKAIQDAAKKYVLSLNKDKWAHIMASKHNWSRVTTSKDKIADLMSQAIANGSRVKDPSGKSYTYTWNYGKHTIQVRTSTGGEISNGWIK